MSQLQHWAEVQDQYQAASRFVEWLDTQYGLSLDLAYAKAGTPLDFRRLLDEFFEIDRRALEDERRALLAWNNERPRQ